MYTYTSSMIILVEIVGLKKLQKPQFFLQILNGNVFRQDWFISPLLLFHYPAKKLLQKKLFHELLREQVDKHCDVMNFNWSNRANFQLFCQSSWARLPIFFFEK